MSVFFSVVVACGIYQGHNHVCLKWEDQSWFRTRAQCITRGGEVSKSIANLVWYAGIKLDGTPKISCREEER